MQNMLGKQRNVQELWDFSEEQQAVAQDQQGPGNYTDY